MASVSASSSAAATQDQYLQLLVAQLKSQNPLEPVSNTDFIAQLSQFNQLANLQTLNANFSEMLKYQQLGQGSNLIGKTVAYVDGAGAAQTGQVSGVRAAGSAITLQVGTDQIGLDQITSVT